MIRADLTQKETVPGTGLDLLKNADFCHPGFSKSQRWNDYILKYFEKKVYHPHCLENATVAESEINSLVNFFGKACRPGEWVPDDEVDKELSEFATERSISLRDTSLVYFIAPSNVDAAK